MTHTFTVDDFTPVRRNTLRGFCRVILPSGMILSDVAVHASGDTAWAMPAGKPLLDRGGSAVREDGKIKYLPIVGFTTKDRRDRFSQAVIDALLIAYPDALE